MAEKRLVIVVDGTAAMTTHWETILKVYLERIIRYYCRNESTSQDPSGGKYALGLVVYGANEPYSSAACLVQPSSWIRDMDIFLQWLSALSFSDGGIQESSIAEGLANALMMFPIDLNGSHIQQCGQRHCILVAASNPSSLPRPVLLPKFEILNSGKFSKARMQCHLADANTVARSFAQSFVSLSVICPKQFPRLIEIYNVGNFKHQATESSASNVKNPLYYFLLSQNFVEAHAALNQLSDSPPLPWNLTDDDTMILHNIFSEQLMSRQEVPSANIFANATVQPNGEGKNWNDGVVIMMHRKKVSESTLSKQETSARDAMAQKGVSNTAMPNVPEHAFGQCSNIRDGSYKRDPNMQTFSHSFTSRDNAGFDEFKVELTPTGLVLSQKIVPRDLAEVNASHQSNLNPIQVMNPTGVRTGGSSASQMIRSGNARSRQTMWSLRVNSKTGVMAPKNAQANTTGSIASLNSNISGNLNISQPSGLQTLSQFSFNLHQTMQQIDRSVPLVKNQQGGLNASMGLSVSEVSNINENLKTSRRVPNLPDRISTCNLSPSMQGNFSRAQMQQQDDNGLKRKHFNAFCQMSIPNEEGTVIPTLEKSRKLRGDVVSFAISSGVETTLSQMSRILPEPPNGYIKAWEGSLTSKGSGQAELVATLVAYRKISSSERLVTNWPQTLHMDQLISQNYVNNLPYKGHVEYLIFDAVNHCTKLGELEEKRLCAYIKLPWQTLILSVPTKNLRLIGALFSEDVPLFKHQIYSP